ncbi:DUF3077 domain-containing protein [Pseudomonas corrugata]
MVPDEFAKDAAFIRDTDRHAWAAHHFTVLGKGGH